MTTQQKRTIEWLRKRLLETDGNGSSEYEFKQFDVKDVSDSSMKPLVFVTSEVGRKGDEGKLSSLFCRRYRLIKIGPRGGTTLLNAKRKNVTGSAVAYAQTASY